MTGCTQAGIMPRSSPHTCERVGWWDEHGLGVGACVSVVQRPSFIDEQATDAN